MDDGLLIEQVSIFPALYDKSDKRYKSKISKEAAWKTIGAVLDEHTLACEQRWLTFRNKYCKIKRDIRSTPSGSGAMQVDWPYYELMGFLDPFLTTRRTTSNATRSSQAWDTLSNLAEFSEDLSPPPTPLAIASVVSEGYSCSDTPEVTAPSQTLGLANHGDSAQRQGNLMQRKRILQRTTPLKRSAQEAVVDKLSSCFDQISKKFDKSSESNDINFAIGLSKDMEILTAEEKIKFKKIMYNNLNDILSLRSNKY